MEFEPEIKKYIEYEIFILLTEPYLRYEKQKKKYIFS